MQRVFEKLCIESIDADLSGVGDGVAVWLEEKRKQVCVERGLVFFIGRVESSSVYVGLAHHTIMDGLGVEELRRRVMAGDVRIY